MATEINQEIIFEINNVANSQQLLLDPSEVSQISQQNFLNVKKIAVRAQHEQTHQPVILKVRPTMSETDKTEFVSDETKEAVVSKAVGDQGVTTSQTLASQFTSSPEWTIRTFIAGEPLGKIVFERLIKTALFFDFLKDLRSSLNNAASNDVNALPNIVFQPTWQQEYAERKAYVVKHLSQEVANYLEELLAQEVDYGYEHYLIHNDLAPQNIIEDNGSYHVIDWGGSKIGPRAADWAMLWIFAVELPDLQQLIYQQAIEEVEAANKEIVHRLFIQLTARMIATFAEACTAFAGSRREQECHRALENTWKNLQALVANSTN